MVSVGRFSFPDTVTKESREWALPKLLLCGPGERESVVKQAVAFRQADSRPPLWHVFWMTLMECGWKERLTLIWTMLRELRRSESKSWVWLFIQNKEFNFLKIAMLPKFPSPPEQHGAAVRSHGQVYQLVSIQVQPRAHAAAEIAEGG